MLFFPPSICFAASLLLTPSLAGPIAFGNPTFNTVRFGVPFPIQWYGGDGTPVTIILNSGHPAKLQPVGSVTTGILSSPYTWTPVASTVVRPGVPYVLSIVQSGLTNYSPFFSIGARAAAPQLAPAIRAPLPIGTAGYYPLQKPMVHDDPAIYPRNDATGGARRRDVATGTIFPRNGPTGVAPSTGTVSELFGTGGGLPDATSGVWSTAVAAEPFSLATYTPLYSTGTGTASLPAYATGGRYINGTATGTVGRAAAYEMTPTASSVAELCDQIESKGQHLNGCSNDAKAIGADVRTMVVVVSAACASLFFWV
ncbi:hypothetical protein XPA_006327 [Xanthoria parietina]